MYFKQILDEHCGCASYLIASRQSHKAAIVDPAISIDQYDELLNERGFTLKYVIDTHVHADHVSGGRKLAAKHGAELCLFETARVTYSFRGLHDGEVLPLGQLELKVVHTPGHRPELISVLVINPPRSAEPSMVLTGDSLLVGDVGRPDFGGGDAGQQYESLSRLLRLPDWVAVFPGHFEGPCGKGMCGRPSTTIGFERLYNPLTRLDRAPFVKLLSSGVPARPLNMLAIEQTNRGAADMPWAMLTTTESVADAPVASMADRSPGSVLIDVREPEEYHYGHVPGAANVPQSELASRLREIPRDRPLYVICEGGMRSLKAARFLRQVGYRQVVNVKDGTGAWTGELAYGDTSLPKPRVTESSWGHAGVLDPSQYAPL